MVRVLRACVCVCVCVREVVGAAKMNVSEFDDIDNDDDGSNSLRISNTEILIRDLRKFVQCKARRRKPRHPCRTVLRWRRGPKRIRSTPPQVR